MSFNGIEQLNISPMMLFIIGCLVLIILWLFFKYLLVICHNKRKEYTRKEQQSRRYIPLKIKRRVLERDDYTCQICGISKRLLDSYCKGLGDYLLLEVDHIDSVANGGVGNDEDNLQVLCWRCNRKKGKRLTNDEVYDLIDYGIEYLDIE